MGHFYFEGLRSSQIEIPLPASIRERSGPEARIREASIQTGKLTAGVNEIVQGECVKNQQPRGLGPNPEITDFFFFWLHWVFIAACELSLVAVSGGYSLLRLLRPLIAVASQVTEHGLWGTQTSAVVVHRAYLHVESSWTRGGTHVPCIGM